MEVIEAVGELRSRIKEFKRQGKTIGFVPTMGFLHEGHISLMKKAREETDIVIVSIFVNPTQFGPNEDFESYPKDMVRDQRLTESVGVDFLFTPTVTEMYPDGYSTFVEVAGDLTRQLCGRTRPGHFRGVTTIVAKLFHMTTPDYAYFGKKDAQQVVVIEKMVRDLNMDIVIVPCSIVREEDGLAMSSRNSYLTEADRKKAQVLSQSLFETKAKIASGERDITTIKQFIVSRIKQIEGALIDYVEIVHSKTLENMNQIKGNILIALAVKFGKTRLIDNIDMVV
ncbi:pantoate--beta-alanine ligase [bacterium]|nr:pantoate--beta-alanine ligase [bacterium]